MYEVLGFFRVNITEEMGDSQNHLAIDKKYRSRNAHWVRKDPSIGSVEEENPSIKLMMNQTKGTFGKKESGLP